MGSSRQLNYNSPFNKWLKDNDIEIYSTYNDGKSLVAERFIRTLKTKFISIWQLCLKMMF